MNKINKNNIDYIIKNGFESISIEEIKFILNKLFYINKLDILTNNYQEKIDFDLLEKIINRKLKNEPIQYIFNQAFFRNYEFYVDNRVLIPRPETELLIDEVINIYNKNFSLSESINIVDIGSGSGAIAISLALEIDKSKIYSVDISKDALEVAQKNKDKYKVKNLEFIHGDKLKPFDNKDIKFDILVSNPPYIKYDDYINLDKNVLDFEPKLALLNEDEEGLGFYKYFAENARKYLKEKSFVIFEIAYHQGNQVADILKKNRYKNVKIIKDYAKIDRMVSASFNL
ncbi:MAG: peptide chain release factor N(5)-glutamine methyltransferase [Candidatus Sericytochromatia bacterium]